jgi:hypothetical protein
VAYDHHHDQENRYLRPPVTLTPEPGSLGPRITFFEHALRLHQQDPGGVLPYDGEPYPDRTREHSRTRPKPDRRLVGADVAEVLDRHFSRPGAHPSELADAFLDRYVPIHRNDHVTAAASRADRQQVRRTGRWLVRHGTERCAVTVGLALLATGSDEGDIPLIQTIGLLSERFGSLAADALQRRPGGGEALLWLARRVAGWGRVYVVEALCRHGDDSEARRSWLLRHACDGDYLNGYFAGKVATAARLHEAITCDDADDELIDHTGVLLGTMARCGGMSKTLEHYPPAPVVLAAHAGHLARQQPSAGRYFTAAAIAGHLTAGPPGRSGCSEEQRDRIVRRYLTVLDRPGWCAAVRERLDPDDEYVAWFAEDVAAPLNLRAFAGFSGDE